jgi:hypothetical protein
VVVLWRGRRGGEPADAAARRACLTRLPFLPACLWRAAFLLNEDLQYDISKVAPQEAGAQALALACRACGHTGERPLPAFPTAEDLQRARLVAARCGGALPPAGCRAPALAIALLLAQGRAALVPNASASTT